MPTEKVSLTLDRDVVGEARALAGPSGLSSLVNEALLFHLQRERVDQLERELETEHGPVDQSLLAQALAERAELARGSQEKRSASARQPTSRKGRRRAG